MDKLCYCLVEVIVIPWRKHHLHLSMCCSQLCKQHKGNVYINVQVTHDATFMTVPEF